MARAKTLADVQEQEWIYCLGTAAVGACIILASLILLYFSKLWLARSPDILLICRVLIGGAIFAGGAVLVKAAVRGIEVRNTKGVEFVCPYCDQTNYLISEPDDDTEEFDCEHCSRKIALEHGAPVPIRAIECEFCHAQHRAAVNVTRYVCDRCNRVIRVDPLPGSSQVRAPEVKRVAANALFDVVLTGIDRRRSGDVAFKLQNLMVVNLPEARRLMESATQTEPLVVNCNLSQLKAESIQRQLQELGAVASVRPSPMQVQAV